MLGRKSAMTLDNKLLLYKSLLKPMWTYAIQDCGAACKSSIDVNERFQSKTVRMLIDAPSYVTNEAIQRDLNLPSVREETQMSNEKYKCRLESHPNILTATLRNPDFRNSRLKKTQNPIDIRYSFMSTCSLGGSKHQYFAPLLLTVQRLGGLPYV
ncbi:hypothetical protein TKK_0000445 [Trichogramma kaykai]